MIEWDAASYQRKFVGSWTLFKNRKTLEKCWLCVSSITETAVTGWFTSLSVDQPLKQEKLSLPAWEPQYYHVPSGWYSRSQLLVRKNNKSYTVGVGISNYRLWTYGPRRPRQWASSSDITNFDWSSLILDSPIKLSADDKKLAIAEWGPITNRLFLTPSEIYYMNSHIGTRKGKEFKLFPKFFAVTQELHDALWEVL